MTKISAESNVAKWCADGRVSTYPDLRFGNIMREVGDKDPRGVGLKRCSCSGGRRCAAPIRCRDSPSIACTSVASRFGSTFRGSGTIDGARTVTAAPSTSLTAGGGSEL